MLKTTTKKRLGLAMMWSVNLLLFVLPLVTFGWKATLLGFGVSILLVGLFVGGLILVLGAEK